jgi:hypothetical protein
VVVVGGTCVVIVVAVAVAVHSAHERLVAQGSRGTVQMEVVMVDRHELPVEVCIGKVVGGVVVVGVSVGRTPILDVEVIALPFERVVVDTGGRVDVTSVVVTSSRSVSRPKVSNWS